jgi:hypothetical protein
VHLLRAARRLDRKTRSRVQVVIVAAAPDTPEILKEFGREVERAVRAGVDVVSLSDALPAPALRQLYSRAAVFVCPSLYEPPGHREPGGDGRRRPGGGRGGRTRPTCGTGRLTAQPFGVTAGIRRPTGEGIPFPGFASDGVVGVFRPKASGIQRMFRYAPAEIRSHRQPEESEDFP